MHTFDNECPSFVRPQTRIGVRLESLRFSWAAGASQRREDYGIRGLSTSGLTYRFNALVLPYLKSTVSVRNPSHY